MNYRKKRSPFGAVMVQSLLTVSSVGALLASLYVDRPH